MTERVVFKHCDVELIDTGKRFLVRVNGKEVYRSPFCSEVCYDGAYKRFRREAEDAEGD
jgi:hypothetical protein